MLDRSLPIQFSRHARRRMAQRHVPQSEVERLVRTGPMTLGDEGEYLATGFLQGKRVKVAFVADRKGRQKILVVKTVILKKGK